MGWLGGMSRAGLALVGILLIVIVVLLGVIVDLKSTGPSSAATVPVQSPADIHPSIFPTLPAAASQPVASSTPRADNGATVAAAEEATIRAADDATAAADQATAAAAPPTGTPVVVSNLTGAQQLAFAERGTVILPRSREARRLQADLTSIQEQCGGNQYFWVTTIQSTWRSIHKRGHNDSMDSVANGMAALLVLDAPDDSSFCNTEGVIYDQMRYLNRTVGMVKAEATETAAVPTETATPEPTEASITLPDTLPKYDQTTYEQVNDHPDVYKGTYVEWSCIIAKFFGVDPDTGNNIVGCWDYSDPGYDGGTGNGEVILQVPARINVDKMASGDGIIVLGKVDNPYQGTTGLGVSSTWPQLDVILMTDGGHYPGA